MSKPEMSALDTQRINRAAAAMAVSNYGHGADPSRILDWWRPNLTHGTPRAEVCDLAGHLMESDDHEEMFAEEAEGWAKTIAEAGGLVPFAEQFPHHKEWLLKLAAAGDA